MVQIINDEIENVFDELKELSEYIYENPELGYEEFKASRKHIQLLKKYGFDVEEQYLEIDTAFRAEYSSNKKGPTIAYLAEYDALDMGHGCGHNILGTTSTGAGIVLKKIIDSIGGTVIVLGTPAEETSGAKVTMTNKGAFDDIDIAMIAHPGANYHESGKSLALQAIEFTFKGKTAHAASNPEKGINALDAVINTFNTINSLREHIKSSARIHGIINEGGRAPNVVPDLAIARFYVRAEDKDYLMELVKKVKNCAKGASLAAGTTLEINNFELSYDNLITNNRLSSLFNKKLKEVGVEKIHKPRDSYGSLDIGNVSQVCPAIHPYFKISEKKIIPHTEEFAQETIKPFAYKNMKKVINALVSSGIEIINNRQIFLEINEEFESNLK